MPWTCGAHVDRDAGHRRHPALLGFLLERRHPRCRVRPGALHPLWYGFWALGVAAALLTAFYMTRLMLYTFHGPNRTGERERAHLHEAPPVMTVPLRRPGDARGGGRRAQPAAAARWHRAPLEHWLEPVTEASARMSAAPTLSHGVEWALIVLAVAIAVTGIVAAWRLLPFERLVPARQAPAEQGFARVLWKAYYVDQIYDRIVVRPIVWVSRQVLWRWIDQGVVDGAGVNGVARGVPGARLVGQPAADRGVGPVRGAVRGRRGAAARGA